MAYEIQYGGMRGGKTTHYRFVFEECKCDRSISIDKTMKEEAKAIRSLYRRR